MTMKGMGHDPSRRRLLANAGRSVGAAAMLGLGVGQASAASGVKWAREVDVVCVGSGAAALTAAVTAANAGSQVLVLEKGPITGGTTRKSGGVFWIPNHYALRERGIDDRKEDCLRHLCRVSYPERYRPDSPTFGLDQDAFALLEAFYDNGYKAVDLMRSRGALRIAQFNMWQLNRPAPDYQDHLPEDKTSQGRSLGVLKADGSNGGGTDYIDQLEGYLKKQGVEILTDHRVQKLILNARQEVVGVEVETEDGVVQIRARKGVVFGTGGYAHNLDYVRLYQRTFLYGSCATPYATGDFITIAGTAGARLGNLGSAWRSQALIEECIENRSLARCVDMPPGDSMFMVNKYGVRVVNEKRNYNDRTEAHLTFDPNNGEFPNQLQFIIYDQRTAELFAGAHPLPATPTGAGYVIQGGTLDELATNIAARLERIRAHIGTVKLAPEFSRNLKQTFERFNGYAKRGVDPDFHRGEAEYDRAWALFFQPARENTRWSVKTGLPNPAMHPLQAKGPYYALIVGAGALDTNGGPVVDAQARVIHASGKPIPGLYGAGNCIASPSREAYFGAGGTIGPAMAFGYIAGMNAAAAPVKEL
ncbi:FAD-dependent oxidoreductase [Aromatoleum diolicum]|uniref:FAD-dependent oxidoreductase n=1 Tax=Aromatoleum diolicum TaxID=75796 RepID=A0ABX1Q6M8_9RHOO|nr:FAD-dependent oxidoreductase [Aromatoleum diolicum]NMG73648.1 FAD-dependent oxidoreductase [Aromatoleum diolicum]